MRIAVAGGTGIVGRYVVEEAWGRGHEAVVLTRSSGVDVREGVGLEGALQGIEAVIDAMNPDTLEEQEATRFFVDATANLQRAGEANGVRRLIVLSIVGIDRAPMGYHAAKLAQERTALDGPVPVTILRATQFHEFAAQIVAWNRDGSSARIPNHRVQTVAARTVAERLIDSATAADAPGGRALDVGGPQTADLVDLARKVVSAFGWGIELSGYDPGTPAGARLPGDGAWLGGPAFDEWLSSPDAERMRDVA